MSESIMYFEQLPNELLMNVFKYFDAGELLYTFYDLNHRLNALIKSMNYLSLVIKNENHDQIEDFQIFSSCLYTLIINEPLNLNLGLFWNLRRLILINPIDELLSQLELYKFQTLEHLSIRRIRRSLQMFSLNQTIFSNGFSNLKSYNLEYKWIGRLNVFTESPILRILKIEAVHFFVLRSILSICPNLYYLDVGIIIENQSSSKIEPHLNLKHLILRTLYYAWPNDQNISIFKDLFTCIPNLERLSIHRRDNISILKKSLIKYDWFSSIIGSCLPLLQRFYCYLHIFQLRNARIQIGPHLRNIVNKIIENFQYVHQNRYQARLIID
jgi:hypothetical protein